MTADPLQDARDVVARLDAGTDVGWDEIETALREVCAPDTTPPMLRRKSAPETARDVIGREIDGSDVEGVGHSMADRILNALTETGFAVVRLPEPSTDSWGDPEWIVPHTATRPGRVRIDSDGRFSALGCPNPSPAPADAEALAAALLAAAAYAKAGEDRG